jgi:acyl-CoA synthetase (AMP-forming)/AMP-acid ligase II
MFQRRCRLVAELAETHPRLEKLGARVDRIARETAAVRVRECLFLPRGELPKTPSGKVQRFRCRELATHPPAGGRTVVR